MLTAETPTATAHISPFKADPELARQAVQKWNKERAELVEDGRRFRELAIEQAKQPKVEAKPDVPLEVSRQIDLANELVAHARAQLKAITEDCYGFCPECKRHGADAKEQAALLRELRGLMEHLCRLHNIAQAPTSKALPARSRSTQAPPIPQPVAVQTPEPKQSQ